jgi:DNA-binding beta-propeller fold protein YncE
MLTLQGAIPIPPHAPSAFDHGDVHLATGRVFVAHTQAGTVEVFDGPERRHVATIPGCSEASGVLVAQADDLVFAAARGAGQVLVIEASTLAVRQAIVVDPRPNGLAWDSGRRQLLVADVAANTARLVTPEGDTLAVTPLPGRPRWCVYDPARERFLVNIREPACVAVLDATSDALLERWPMPSAGPHGLDLAPAEDQAYVACDGGEVTRAELADGRVTGQIAIAGVPDALWCNPKRARLYVAVGDPGVVQVIDTRAMQVVQTVTTEPGAHTTAFDDERQRLYVFLPTSCRAAAYDELDIVPPGRTEAQPDRGAVTRWEDEGGATAKGEEAR